MKQISIILKSILCLTLVSITVACAPDKETRTEPAVFRAIDDGDGAVGENITSSALDANISGVVVSNLDDVEDGGLNRSVRAFVTSFMNPDDSEKGLGFVSSVFRGLNEEGSTGVRFSVNACLNNKPLNSSITTGNVDQSTAAIKLYIKDEFAAVDDGQYGVIEIEKYVLKAASIGANSLSLIFENPLGTISLIGGYSSDSQFYYGDLKFTNARNVNGGAIQSLDLGKFYIPAGDISRGCN